MILQWKPLVSLAAISLALAACGGDNTEPQHPTAATQKGVVQGVLHSSGTMNQFLGIPYAEPPVGALRWRAPVAPAAWTGTRDTSKYGNHCPQKDTSPLSSYGTAGGQEDCLYLNVFTPTTPGPHPVMVWIHGGAFIYGRGLGYTPTRLIEKGVVVVTINYRLGALGFLAHPALNDAAGHSGNYGVMDQTLALRWVKDNIASFGGDPANVTVAGQSAGAASVLTQLNTPKAAGLFQKAILESGPAGSSPTGSAAQTSGATAASTDFGCPNDANAAACLRALPLSTIIAKQSSATFSASNAPNVDGDYLVQSNAQAVSTGKLSSKVPILIGNTANEYTSLLASEETALNNPDVAPGSPASVLKLPGAPGYKNLLATDAELSARLAASFGPLANTVNAQYPASAYGGSRPLAYSAAITDSLFACGNRQTAKALTASGIPVYAYEFDDPNAPMALQPPVSYPFLSYHASEIQYLFDLPSTAQLNDAQRVLASRMVDYWTQFVKSPTGNPNASGNAWPAYTGTEEQVLRFSPAGVSVFTNFKTLHKCSTLWTPSLP